MPFLKGGRHLWTHFSQLFSDKNEEFLCPSERKFPELFKTHPTFVYSPLLVPSMACQTQRGVFFETPCIYASIFWFRQDLKFSQCLYIHRLETYFMFINCVLHVCAGMGAPLFTVRLSTHTQRRPGTPSSSGTL